MVRSFKVEIRNLIVFLLTNTVSIIHVIVWTATTIKETCTFKIIVDISSVYMYMNLLNRIHHSSWCSNAIYKTDYFSSPSLSEQCHKIHLKPNMKNKQKTYPEQFARPDTNAHKDTTIKTLRNTFKLYTDILACAL